MIVLRESNGNVFVLTDLGTDQLILEARDEASGTDGQGVVLSFSASEGNAVYGTVKVKLDDVAALNCSVIYIDGSGVVLSFLVNLFVDMLVSYFNVALLNLYAFVLAKGNFRFHSNLCSEDEGFAGLDLGYIDLRTGNDLKIAVLQSLCICSRDQIVGSIFIENACAIHFLDQFTRCFTFTEARDIDSSSGFQIYFLNCFFKVLGRSLDGQLRHVFFQFFNL